MELAEPIPADEGHDDAEHIAAVEAGLASLNAGRSIPYEVVRQWLLSWGTEAESPPPVCR